MKSSKNNRLRLLLLGLVIFSVNLKADGNNSTSHSTPINERISLNFQQTPVAIILQALANSRNLNLIMSEDISLIQTIELNEVTWQKALDLVLSSAKLKAEMDDNILKITKQESLDELKQKKLQQQKEQEQKAPLHFLTMNINHTDLTKLQSIIEQQGLLSERGKIITDQRTNRILIYDIQKKFTAIKQLVKELDIALPQIHLSAQIVNMSQESLSELGIKWNYTGNDSTLINAFDVGFTNQNPSSTINFNLAKLSGNLLNLQLSALASENQVEIIASPTLLTSNQHMASIKQGTEIPYEVSSGNNNATTIEFKQAVLGLEVTPKIVDDEQLLLDISITQNTVGKAIKRSNGGEALAIDTQEVKTQVLVNNGETVILGGIFQQLNNQNQDQVPLFSSLPMVGNLFKHKGMKQQKKELVIFITPHLVE